MEVQPTIGRYVVKGRERLVIEGEASYGSSANVKPGGQQWREALPVKGVGERGRGKGYRVRLVPQERPTEVGLTPR